MATGRNFYLALLAILLGLTGFTILIVRDNHKQDNAKFTDVINRTYEMSFADERLINTCKTAKSSLGLIHNDVERVTSALENLVKAEYAAGSLISKETFCKMLAFNMVNNAIIEAGDDVCTSKALITTEQNDAYKHDLLTRIGHDQLSHHSFFSDDSVRKYTRNMCQKS